MVKRKIVVLILVICGLFHFGCFSKKMVNTGGAIPEKSLVRNLEWKPTMTNGDLDISSLNIYGNRTLSIISIRDARENSNIIGEVYEDRKTRTSLIPIATQSSVTKWANGGFVRVLNGFNLKHSDKQGDLRLDIEIIRFSIFDDFTQTGTMELRINAFNSDEMLIWEGRINGTSDLYVHPTGSDGISECLSNTAMVTLFNLLSERSFRDAVTQAYD